MQIHVNKDYQQIGPYDLEQVNQCLEQGTLSPTNPAWHEGSAGWVPLNQMEGVIVPGTSTPPPFDPATVEQSGPVTSSADVTSPPPYAGPSPTVTSTPKSKSNAPLVIGIIAGLFILIGLVAAGGLYFFVLRPAEKAKAAAEAEDRLNYLQWRDALVATANYVEWDYHKPSDPQAGREIAELEFDGSVRKVDLYYLWELIQPHFILRYRMNNLDMMDFNDSYFRDQWMTNLIGLDRTGYPYRTEGLQRLFLENTKITDTGLKHLYEHVSYLQPKAPKIQAELASFYAMTNLLEINVYGCKGVTKQSISDLKKALPHLKIVSTFKPY